MTSYAIDMIFMTPSIFFELATGLWLLVKGVNVQVRENS